MIDLTSFDPIQTLCFDSSHPVRGGYPRAIMGNPERHDFLLVDLLAPLPAVEMARLAEERGHRFIGFLGIVNGTPQSALAEPIDNAAIAILTRLYMSEIEKGLQMQLGIAELARIYALPSNEYDA